tara:strand:+ start:860 stop:1012 length:153 start_codon:yes stop_codon:yes gene_type:complete
MDVGNVRTHYSHQSKDALLELYNARIEALSNKVQFLEAQLEVLNNQLYKH